MTLNMIVKRHWEKEGVKFKARPFKWVKTLRTADCAFCRKHQKEKEIDQGFSGWAILTHVSNLEGKAPEVCPKCLVNLGIKLTVTSPRTISCIKCGTHQKEKIYGIGWPGWSPLPSIAIVGQPRESPQLCPNCSLGLAKKLGKEFIRGTWTELTYAPGSLLTSTKMTQNQANFEAMAKLHSGAPVLDVVALHEKKHIWVFNAEYFNEISRSNFFVTATGDALLDNSGGPLGVRIYGGSSASYYAQLEFGGFTATSIMANFADAKNPSFLSYIRFSENFLTQADHASISVGSNLGIADPHGFGFFKDGGDTNFYAACGNGVGNFTKSIIDLTSIDLTEIHAFKAILTSGVKCEFYIDNVLKATITTNLPSEGYGPLMTLQVGSNASFYLLSWVFSEDR